MEEEVTVLVNKPFFVFLSDTAYQVRARALPQCMGSAG